MDQPCNYIVVVGDRHGRLNVTRGLDWAGVRMVAELMAESFPTAHVLAFNEDLMDGSPDAKNKNGLTEDEEIDIDEAIRRGHQRERG